MVEVLPVAFLLVSSTFSVILLVMKTKNILETCLFYFVSSHKHKNISMIFCVAGADPAQNLTGSNHNPKNFDRGEKNVLDLLGGGPGACSPGKF